MATVEPPPVRADPPIASDDAHRSDDLIGAAVALGRQRTRARTTSLRTAWAEAKDLLNQARSDGAFRASLPRALDLVNQHPEDESLQNTAARLIMEDGDACRGLSAWSGVHSRFPTAMEPFRMVVRMTLRTRGEVAAREVLQHRFPNPGKLQGEEDLLALAFAYEELARAGDAEEAFRNAARLFPGSRNAWRHLIRLQELRGGLMSAQHSAALAMAGCGGEDFVRTHTRLTREILTIESLSPNIPMDDSPYSVKALTAILDDVLTARRSGSAVRRGHLGSTLLISGSLGSGGAERQLVTTALSLNDAAGRGRLIDGYDVAGPVAVACRSLTSKTGNDFYLGALSAAGIEVTEYGRLAPFGGQLRLSRAKPYSAAIDFLPARMKEGVVQLVDFLRHEHPDVVHIWQDGMVFAVGLAALMADVPRIVLSVRTLPPIDRVNRWRLELEPIYRALLSSPGVVMTANSTLVARRYEDWLRLHRGAIPVINNGVSRLDETPAAGDEAVWRAFAQRTADADITVGAVMRLDQNKRPLDWLSVAERFHRMHHRSRFIIVGDGALRQEAQDYAQRLGIADRVLFTGLSGSVGYWLGRMDTLMLLSRFEGMPNVLIEAQLAGKPVITTPAGGAPETLLPGRTGWVLSNAETIDVDEAAACLMRLAAMPAGPRHEIAEAARTWAEQAFSVETMLERTVRVFMAPYHAPMLPEA